MSREKDENVANEDRPSRLSASSTTEIFPANTTNRVGATIHAT